MEALTAAVHSKRPLYHASISPEAHTPLSNQQVRIAADTLERKLGLGDQPRVVVVHRKHDREHIHVVWSRIDIERQRVISDAWNYRHHEEAARELEAAFGHRAIRGVHVPGDHAPRPRRTSEDYEHRQAERSGMTAAQVSDELAALWHGSGDAGTFRKKVEEAGYTLARGDRRVFVVIDRAGNVHSLSRRLGLRSRDLTARLRGLPLDSLPSVAAVRETREVTATRTVMQTQYRAAAGETVRRARLGTLPAMRRKRSGGVSAPAIRAQVAWINCRRMRPALSCGGRRRDLRSLAAMPRCVPPS